MKLPEIKTFTIEEDPKQQALKVLEEAGEFVEAVKKWAENPKAFGEAMDEGADVLQALCNTFEMMGAKDINIRAAMKRCEKRNADRGRL